MKIAAFHNGHDVSYCVLDNGIPVLHNELERFIRVKEPWSECVPFLWDTYDGLSDIDIFVDADYEPRWDPAVHKKNTLSYQEENYDDKWDYIKNKQYTMIGHHQSHAAAAFYTSNFDEALIVTMDGGGGSQVLDDGELKTPTTSVNTEKTPKPFSHTALTIWEGKGNKIKPIDIIPTHFINLGTWWSKTTRALGLCGGHCHYQSYEDWKKNPDPKGWFGHAAGTTMAMGTIGKPDEKLTEEFQKFMAPGLYKQPEHNTLDLGFDTFNGRKHKNEDELFEHSCMVAASLQTATENIMFKTIGKYLDKYPHKNLCLSGGVSLNAVATGKMYDELNVEKVHVDPIPADNGLCLGAGLYTWHHILDKPRTKWKDNLMSYLGKTYSKNDVRAALSKYTDKIIETDSNDDEVVDLLTNQNIVAVFGGGSESGRRALGNRSILADPRSPKMKDMINEKVKHRQWFRPFAPSVLREDVKDWFDKDIDSPYMSFVIKFKESVRNKVPAVVHLDGSARLQTVTKNDNKWYYNFISKFKEKTDVPIVLNTSFNDREPIVETPENAINCFLGTDIDYLYFYEYNILIKKNNKENK